MNEFWLVAWWGELPAFVRFGTAVLLLASGAAWMVLAGPTLGSILLFGIGLILTIAALEISGE